MKTDENHTIIKRWMKKFVRGDGEIFDVVQRSDGKYAWVFTGTNETSEYGWNRLEEFLTNSTIHSIVKTTSDFVYDEGGVVDAEFVEVAEVKESTVNVTLDTSWFKQSNGICYFCNKRNCKHLS